MAVAGPARRGDRAGLRQGRRRDPGRRVAKECPSQQLGWLRRSQSAGAGHHQKGRQGQGASGCSRCGSAWAVWWWSSATTPTGARPRTSSKSPRRIDFAQPKIPTFSALPHPHTPIEGWWGSGECPACTTSAPPRLGKVGQGMLRLSYAVLASVRLWGAPSRDRAGCCRRHAPQIHKPSARVSFGLPDPLSFRVRSPAMVLADRGQTLDREASGSGCQAA